MPARAAVVRIREFVYLTTIRVHGVTVEVIRTAGNAAATTGTRRRAVGRAADGSAGAAVARISSQRLLTAVRGIPVTVAVKVGASAHRACAAGTLRRRVSVRAHRRTSAAVVYVRTGVLFAAIGRKPIAIAVPRTTSFTTGARRTRGRGVG
jgi:hypothetical protein